MRFLKDIDGEELLLDSSDYQVMMEWEKNYMSALVDTLQPRGKVLEVGFGLGYSADRIQSYDIDSHTIIEASPEVLLKARDWATRQKHPVQIIEGFWQDKLSSLGKFDSVFFDDAPVAEYLDVDNTRIYDFFYRLLKTHASIGCKLTWYCDAPIYWLSHPDTSWSLDSVNIDIPDKAKYVPFIDNCRKQLYCPLVTFPRGARKDVESIVFNNFLEFKYKGWV